MIGLAEEIPEQDKEYELHRLLGTLLSQHLEAKEKMQIVEEEYHIAMEQKFREDLKIMCNLSQGVKEEGIAMGHKFGLEQGRREAILETTNNVISNMHEKGYTIMEIADVLKMSSEEVIERLEKR